MSVLMYWHDSRRRFHDRIDVRVADGGAGGIVEDHMRGRFVDLFRAGGDLFVPFWTGGQPSLTPEKLRCPAELALEFFEVFLVEGDLDLLDVVAVEEKFDAAQERFAAIDFDESAGGFGELPPGGAVRRRTEKADMGCSSCA